MLKRVLIGVAAALVLALLVFLWFLERETSDWYVLLEKDPPGKHTAATGDFSAETDERGICAQAVERSLLWQALLGTPLAGPEASRPAARFTLELARDEAAPQVSACLRVRDAQGKLLYEDRTEEYVPRRRLKWKGIPIATLAPRAGDYREAEARVVFNLLNLAALNVIRARPEVAESCAPALLAVIRREYERPGPWQPHKAVLEGAKDALTQLAGRYPEVAAQLVQALKDPLPDMRRTAAEVFAKVKPPFQAAAPGLTALLDDTQAEVANEAAWALGEMGQEARDAIPALAKAMAREGRANERACGALYKIGGGKERIPAELAAFFKPALPHLVRVVRKSDDHQLRAGAAALLGASGSEAREAVPALSEAARGDKDSMVREAAAKALGLIGDPAGVPPLAAALKDKEALTAMYAAQGLECMGLQAAGAAPDLIGALRHPNSNARAAAAKALACVASHSPEASKALREALGDDAWRVREAAAAALGVVTEPDGAVASALGQALSDKDSNVVKAALESISKRGPNAAGEVQPNLLACLKSANSDVRARAAECLGTLRAPAAEVVRALGGLLEDREDKVCAAAGKALAGWGAGAAPAFAQVFRAWKGGRYQTRSAAEQVLKGLGDAAGPAWADILRKEPARVREALPFLQALSAAALEPAAQALLEAYQGADSNTKARIAGELVTLKVRGDLIAPLLVKELDQDPYTDGGRIRFACNGLQELGASALPALAAGLKHAQARVRARCANVLGELGAAAREAVPALQALLKDRDREVRAAAEAALAKIH